MSLLVYYQNEKVEHKEAFSKEFDCSKSAEIVLFKLIRHFKLPKPYVSWTSMTRMIAYCEKKNWFEEEINRRTAPKPIYVPNPVEIRQKELIKAQEKIVRYEKKIIFYQRKLSKASRSLAMKQRWIQKQEIQNGIQ